MLFFVTIAVLTVWMLTSHSSDSGYHVVPWQKTPPPPPPPPPQPPKEAEPQKSPAELEKERKKQEYERHEQALRDEFASEYDAARR